MNFMNSHSPQLSRIHGNHIGGKHRHVSKNTITPYAMGARA